MLFRSQSDYYQIPQSDLEKIKEEEEKNREKLLEESEKLEEIVLVKIVQEKQGLKEIPCEVSSSVFYDVNGKRVDGNE